MSSNINNIKNEATKSNVEEGNPNEPIIRRRIPKSQRSRTGLIQYANDNTSQNGEDGIIAKIFEMIHSADDDESQSSASSYHCVDIGAWDGKHLSNSYSLLVNPSSSADDPASSAISVSKWRGILIEADQERYQELAELHRPLGNTCVNTTVTCNDGSTTTDHSTTLPSILKTHSPGLPKDFDFLSIDVDGPDYWLLFDLLKSSEGYKPKVICIEANPTVPNDLIYIPPRSNTIRHGASLAALVELAERYDYVLVETTIYNAFFVTKELYLEKFQKLVPDTSIETLHEVTMGTDLYQLYDGTLKLWGCKKLLWHRQTINEDDIQVLKHTERSFPFCPPKPAASTTQSLEHNNIVNLSPYCDGGSTTTATKEVCSESLIDQLKSDGFALVNGFDSLIDNKLCQRALRETYSFLYDADESVRRSCLSVKDRARRGYSPINTENFASLLGNQGPNDLVRKFRIGPTTSGNNANPLLQPNLWPKPNADDGKDVSWNEESCQQFQSTIEQYYDALCQVSNTIVKAICDGLISKQPHLKESLSQSITSIASDDDGDDNARVDQHNTSILTLLNYCKGTRHHNSKTQQQQKKKNKKRFIHPLVAAHTDVGIITVLLFDAGDCAVLQRQLKDDGSQNQEIQWADVTLPSGTSSPTFVVNIADCLSELSDYFLPSTLHRVMPSNSGLMSPRNCLALFVGLDPNQNLHFHHRDGSGEGNNQESQQDGMMTYEEWRKQRIIKSQTVLKQKNNDPNKKS